MKESERGAALVTVLLLVAVMSALVAVSFDKLNLSIKRERNRLNGDEARINMISAEYAASQQVTELLQRDPNRTDGNWQGQAIVVPVPNGRIVARLIDGGNCFNVNALVTRQPDGTLIAQPVTMLQLAKVAALRGLPPVEANAMAAAITDWIDSDQATLPGGAEDEQYQRGKSPYRTANGWIYDISDLRMVMGMTPEIYARLRPLLCALPGSDLPAYNINTITAEKFPLIASLLPDAAPPAIVADAMRNRPQGGFASVSDFLAQSSMRGLSATAAVSAQLRVRTDWFRLEMMAEQDQLRVGEVALIDSRLKPARVVHRSYAGD